MATTTIEVAVLIGDVPYSLQVVGDPDDIGFAVQVGRAVTNCLVTHTSTEGKG